MKRATIALLVLLVARVASAEVLVLTKGEFLPKNAQPSGLEGMREWFVQIDGGQTWLDTSEGEIHQEFIAWRDKADRFTIGWDLEDGRIVRVYYYKGAPKWLRGKMTPTKWPASGSITVDIKSGAMVEKKPAEHGGVGQPPTRPESKSERSDKPQSEAKGRSR